MDLLAKTRAGRSFYFFLTFLPSLFNTDLDRGFSVIDYGLNKLMAQKEDLEALDALGIDLKLSTKIEDLSVSDQQFVKF